MVKQSRLGLVAGFACTLALIGWMSGGAAADVKDKDAAKAACCAKDGPACGGMEGKACCAKAEDGKACAGHCCGHEGAKSCGKGCRGKAAGDEKAATSCGSGCCKGRAKASAAVL